MNYLNFDCPSCGQNLEAPEQMAGTDLECPACSRTFRIPHPPPGAVAVPDDDNTPSEPGIHEEQEEFQKSSTVRMEIPDEYRKPAPNQRIVKIKRLGK